MAAASDQIPNNTSKNFCPLRLPTSTNMKLVVDEDTLKDSERSHTTEKVAYLIFE